MSMMNPDIAAKKRKKHKNQIPRLQCPY